MPRPKTGDELESLRRQQAEIAEKIKVAEQKQRERSRETQQRRELLAGRAVLAWIDRDRAGDTAREIIAAIDGSIKKKSDRELFVFLKSTN